MKGQDGMRLFIIKSKLFPPPQPSSPNPHPQGSEKRAIEWYCLLTRYMVTLTIEAVWCVESECAKRAHRKGQKNTDDSHISFSVFVQISNNAVLPLFWWKPKWKKEILSLPYAVLKFLIFVTKRSSHMRYDSFFSYSYFDIDNQWRDEGHQFFRPSRLYHSAYINDHPYSFV